MQKKNNTFWLILKVHCKFFTIHCNRVNISFCTNLVKIWSSVQRFYLDKQFSFFCFSKLHILSMAQNNSICFNNQPIILLVAIFFFRGHTIWRFHGNSIKIKLRQYQVLTVVDLLKKIFMKIQILSLFYANTQQLNRVKPCIVPTFVPEIFTHYVNLHWINQ